MKVIYYTFTPFLDCAIEFINVLKKHVELHVVIEISPENKTSNIVDVDKLPEENGFVEPAELLDEQQFKMLEPYLRGTASAKFLVYTHTKSFSFTTLKQSLKLGSYIKKLKPDVLHFEGFSLRSMGMIPSMMSVKKVFYTVHDPLPHSGEFNWRLTLAKFLYFKLADGFFFYSQFARRQFEGHYKKQRAARYDLKLFPYHFYKAYSTEESNLRENVLFFGRISPYKGVDVLLNAMPGFLKDHPEEELLIAGKSMSGYTLSKGLLAKYSGNIKVIDRYLSNQELVSLISKAKVVVCPYRDATQSGVLMTAFALNTPVIATDVGAFPEYISENENGLLFPVNDSGALAEKLAYVIESRRFEELEQRITHYNLEENWSSNLPVVLQAYTGDIKPVSSKENVLA